MKPASGQGGLFGPQKTGREAYEEAERPTARLNSTVEPRDRKALETKYAEVLARMERGPATATELNAVCFRYSARLEEITKAGIAWGKERMKGRLYLYFLTKHKAEAERILGRTIGD